MQNHPNSFSPSSQVLGEHLAFRNNKPPRTRQRFAPELPDAGQVASASQSGVVLFQEAGNGVTRFQTYDKKYEKLFQQQVREYQKQKRMIPSDEQIVLNVIQRSMFRRVYYGLKEFPPQEIAALSPDQMQRIVSDHKKCNEAMHKLKVSTYYKGATELINACFPHIKLGTKLSDFMVELPKSETLRKLGIGTRQVINELISLHLLPDNFFELSVDTLKLA